MELETKLLSAIRGRKKGVTTNQLIGLYGKKWDYRLIEEALKVLRDRGDVYVTNGLWWAQADR